MQCTQCPFNNVKICGQSFCILPRCIYMPDRQLRPCKHIGCAELTRDKSGYCEAHKVDTNEYRGSARERGYTRQWERESKAFLQTHPLCVCCESKGQYRASQVVDHIKPHRGNQQLFWDKTNWQGLCKHHHDKKTARGE